jgi:PleD family two-component response regulator
MADLREPSTACTRRVTRPSRRGATVGDDGACDVDPALPDRPILVVDDDAKIVRLVRTYLERDGFAVVTAADGPAALAAIEEHRPALVVLDLMLPELDGRAVIRAPAHPTRIAAASNEVGRFHVM